LERRRGVGVGACDRAEDRDAELVEGVGEDAGVAFGSDAIEDDAADADLGVERAEPVDEGGDGAALRGRVDDEDDRGFEEFGDVGGRGEFTFPGRAVIQPHDALDDRDVRVP
jgi:hypothetical protein